MYAPPNRIQPPSIPIHLFNMSFWQVMIMAKHVDLCTNYKPWLARNLQPEQRVEAGEDGTVTGTVIYYHICMCSVWRFTSWLFSIMLHTGSHSILFVLLYIRNNHLCPPDKDLRPYIQITPAIQRCTIDIHTGPQQLKTVFITIAGFFSILFRRA